MNKKDLQEKLERLQSNKQGIDNKIEKLKKEIEEYKPKSIYDLEKGDKYCVIYTDGDIRMDNWHNLALDQNRLENGNAFLTREEAQEEVNYRQAVARVKKWYYDNNAGVDMSKIDKNDSSDGGIYVIDFYSKDGCYNFNNSGLSLYTTPNWNVFKEKIVVKNIELAKKLIKAHSEDLKTILNHNQFKGF